ncbi:SRPBCC family protein [Streptomyces apocyni]|uniref:SRPBCC family protein n=1 Tax=Streptomyces apocyni TaxID=2654677 RepID=UPI0012EA8870|nr:SRPBCC family protein [Streptomyces apocyni]
MAWLTKLAMAAAVGGGAAAGYLGLVSAALPLDVGIGRRTRPLGPQIIGISAPRDVVFEVIAQPYLGQTTRAMRQKVRVLERGSDMVLATHFTPLADGRLKAVTVETVRFTAPERVDFRLVRGPVPFVVESFVLTEHASETHLVYEGELATDLWALGQCWGRLVARHWEETVATALTSLKQEAERRTAR